MELEYCVGILELRSMVLRYCFLSFPESRLLEVVEKFVCNKDIKNNAPGRVALGGKVEGEVPRQSVTQTRPQQRSRWLMAFQEIPGSIQWWRTAATGWLLQMSSGPCPWLHASDLCQGPYGGRCAPAPHINGGHIQTSIFRE